MTYKHTKIILILLLAIIMISSCTLNKSTEKILIANHQFEFIKTNEVNITNQGFDVKSNSKAEAKLMDVDFNKLKRADFKTEINGNLENGDYSEISVSIEDENNNIVEVAVMGSRADKRSPSIRKSFNFKSFSLEKSNDVIYYREQDAQFQGRTLIIQKNDIDKLNKNQKWHLNINGEVNGIGNVSIKIMNIEVS
ncbi:MAG: hypothetical protein AABY22_29855 [Nanoarchaeota archaeon]